MTEYRREVRELQNTLDLLSPSESYLVETSLDELMAAQRMFIRRMLKRARLEERLPVHELKTLGHPFERWSTQGIGDFQVYSAAVKLLFIRHLERLPETVSGLGGMLSEYPAISGIIHASAARAPSHGEACRSKVLVQPDSGGLNTKSHRLDSATRRWSIRWPPANGAAGKAAGRTR